MFIFSHHSRTQVSRAGMFLFYCCILCASVVLATLQARSKHMFVKGVIDSHGLHMKELCTLAFVELSSVALSFYFCCKLSNQIIFYTSFYIFSGLFEMTCDSTLILNWSKWRSCFWRQYQQSSICSNLHRPSEGVVLGSLGTLGRSRCPSFHERGGTEGGFKARSQLTPAQPAGITCGWSSLKCPALGSLIKITEKKWFLDCATLPVVFYLSVY